MSSAPDRDQGKRYSAALLSSQRITPEAAYEEVRHLVFQVDDPSFVGRPGQSVRVAVPGPDGSPHFRFYSLAGDGLQAGKLVLCVRRCDYVDPVTLETHRGLASNHLCDLQPGQSIRFVGPLGAFFPVPANPKAAILMIGMGTGIAPFRAYVRHLFEAFGGWAGKIRLFYGARTGLEMLYMNDQQADVANYFDHRTFKAFQALSPAPRIDAPVDMNHLLAAHAMEVWSMIDEPDTHVFVAGREASLAALENPLGALAETDADWKRRKKRMQAEGRWVEVLY